VLAAAGNSPLLLGHRLWEETRVALFRQAVDERVAAAEEDWRPARVSFGHGWVRRGAFELFAESVALHPALLPSFPGASAIKDAFEHGVKITSAMISDVPGMTWNMVPTLAQAGIRYFSAGPNGIYTGGDRTGFTNRAWADRPFYWISPSGTEKILYWMTGFGYGSMFAGISAANSSRLTYLKSFAAYADWLDKIGYPYDMIQMRHTIKGDNGTVDPDLPDYVKEWNITYV
jgi:hypothetical protein